MRMRIAGAHHGAAIFENLDVIDIFQFAQLPELFYPCADDELNFVQPHSGECEIVTRRKTNHAANSRFRFGDEQPHVVDCVETERARFEVSRRRSFIVEDERGGVHGVSNSARPQVAGAKIAARIVSRLRDARKFRDFPLPGTRRAMRRDQYPLVGQRIQPAMRIFREFQIAASQHSTMNGSEDAGESRLLSGPY